MAADDLTNTLNCKLSGALMLKILSRLPEQSLLKFRSVSKSWQTHVDNTLFISDASDFWSRSGNYNSFTMLNAKGIDEIECGCKKTKIGQTAEYAVVGSWKGLICVTPWNSRFAHEFVIVHRATMVEEFGCQWPRTSGSSSQSFVSVGFGFDKLNEDFKILRVERFRRSPHIYVYSLNADSWKRIKSSHNINLQSPLGHTFGSCLYWMSFDGSASAITAFNLSTETFHSIRLPTYPTESLFGGFVSESQESLAAIFYDWNDYKYRVWTVSLDQVMNNSLTRSCLDKNFRVKETIYYDIEEMSSPREDGDVAFSCGDKRLTCLNFKFNYKLVHPEFSEVEERVRCYQESVVPEEELLAAKID